MSLLYIAQQITIYIGFFLLVAGIIGNGINILVFSTVRTYRTTPCTFYFLIASIHNFVYIIINLISRIVSTGFEIDLTNISTSWCKIRQFCLVSLGQITVSCSCLAIIDQYFITSQSANLRRLSSIKWAHRIVIIVIIVWCLHGILPLVFLNISPVTKTCTHTDAAYHIYSVVYLLGLVTSIPVSMMVVFGYLTYRNIHLTRVLGRQRVDRQMTRMVLIQVVFDVVSLVPFGINAAYILIKSTVNKDTNQSIGENFALIIVTLLSYFYYAGTCYSCLISSSRFRRAVKDRIFFFLRPNRVGVLQ